MGEKKSHEVEVMAKYCSQLAQYNKIKQVSAWLFCDYVMQRFGRQILSIGYALEMKEISKILSWLETNPMTKLYQKWDYEPLKGKIAFAWNITALI